MKERQVEEFVKLLDLHPIRALRLAELLRTDASLIADKLEAVAEGPPVRGEAINIRPERPTLESIRHKWRLNTDVDEDFLNGQFDYASAQWDHLYATVSPEQSRALTDKVKAAFDFDWEQDEAHEKFEDTFAVIGSGYVLSDTIEALFRSAIRPWPEERWRGVEVGNVSFDETPSDLYRLLFLCKPVALDFDDMYGCGLFGITSPCGRFAMQFYLHKYELAAYQLVVEDLAIRTRPAGALSIRCGIPGVDNGVATTDADAIAWFDMIFRALKREWSVYPGNDFAV
jgi:hypothetical protein